MSAKTGVRGPIDFSHSPGAKECQNSIRAELIADADRHDAAPLVTRCAGAPANRGPR